MLFPTIQIKNKRLFDNIKNICNDIVNDDLISIGHLQKKNNRGIYVLNFNSSLKLRFDVVGKKYAPVIPLRLMLQEKVSNVSKLLFHKNINVNKIWLISEWINGKEMKLLECDSNQDKIIFPLFGELVGKINSIKNGDLCLSNTDMNLTNLIVTNLNEVFVVDHDHLRYVSHREFQIVKLLLKRIKDKKRMYLFLDGYQKFFPVENIIRTCKGYHWTWGINVIKK